MPDEPIKKRFVICLDGTWNNAATEVERQATITRSEEPEPRNLWNRVTGFFSREPDPAGERTKVYRPTNVLKIARAAEIEANGVLQITYYDAGVGAMNRAPTGGARIIRATDNILGGVLGAGFEENIEEAYTFLANNYAAGDEVFVFGFSRGAAQARSLCSFLAWAGGVPDKDDVYYAPRLFTRYLEQYGGGENGSVYWANMNSERAQQGRSALKPLQPVNIQFLGIWDTVLSLGRRLRSHTPVKHQFHNTPTVPPGVLSVRHALAIDEIRHDFQAEVFVDGSHADLEQRWFAGVHSNVGGGLKDDSLANRPLQWIVEAAREKGLSVDDNFLRYFRSDPLGWAGKRSRGFAIGDTIGRPIRGYRGLRHMPPYPTTVLDDSVVKRLMATKLRDAENEAPYRPENLMTYLQDSPHYQSTLDTLTP